LEKQKQEYNSQKYMAAWGTKLLSLFPGKSIAVKWINIHNHNYSWLELEQSNRQISQLQTSPFYYNQSSNQIYANASSSTDSLVENKSNHKIITRIKQAKPHSGTTQNSWYRTNLFISPHGHKKKSHIFASYLKTTISCNLTRSHRYMGLGGNNFFNINNLDF